MKRMTFFLLCSLLLTTTITAQVTIFPYKDSWKYLDAGTDQGTAWRSPSFSDASWKSGNGKLGYGMDGLTTVVSYGAVPSQKYPTTYFRKTISITEPAIYNSFTGTIAYDDGVVVYLNGAEVYRSNMPAGTIGYSTLAVSSTNTSKTFTLGKEAFVPGTNLLAVEVHQNSLSNGDLAFDMKLVGNADETVPRVVSSSRLVPQAALTNATAVTYRVTFSEKVTGVDRADFAVTPTSGTPGGTVSSVTPVDGSATTYDVAVTDITGTGALKLSLKSTGTAIADMAGNAAPGYTNGQGYTIDRTPPTLLGINRQSPTTSLTNAPTLVFRASFSEAMAGVDAADFAVTRLDGSVAGTVQSVTPSGTAGTLYDITVAPVTGSGTLRLDLKASGAGITDIATNALLGGITTGQTFTVDQVVPYVSSISRLTPLTEITKASTVVYRVVFTEKVTSVGVADFSVVATSGTVKGTIESGDVDMMGTDGTTYDVKVTSISGTGQLRIDLKGTGTGIVDAAKNACGGYSAGQTFSIDKTVPRVQSIERYTPAAVSTNGSTVVYRATFTEPVSGVDSADFSLTTVSGTAKGVLAPGGITPVGTGGTTWDVKVGALTGNGELRLNVKSSGTGIVDVVANALGSGFTTGQSYTLDHTAPTVVSVSRQLPAVTTTNVTSLTYRVVFSEAVTGVSYSDFSFSALSGTTTGAVPAGGVVLAGTAGTTYDVTVSNVSGSGLVRLDVKASGTGITDIATNALNGGFTTGQAFTVDQTRPEVSGIARQTPLNETTNTSSVVWRVTFSERVTGLDISDFVLHTLSGGPTGALASVATVGTAGTTFDVTASGITTFSTVRLDVAGGAVVEDAVGNALSGGYALGQTYNVDPPATVVSVHRLAPAGEQTNASSVTWQVSFSEKVTGVDAADFTLATVSGVASGAVGSVVPAGSTGSLYEVTISGLSTTEVVRLDIKASGTGISDSYGSPLSDGPSATGSFTFAGFKSGQTYSIDKTLPVVVSSNRQLPTGSLTNGSSVTWRVAFSEKVTGVDAADFTLTPLSGTTTGTLASNAVVAVGTEGTTYDITATALSGTGSLRLDLRNGGTGIFDGVGNAPGSGYVSGQSYSFDYTVPSPLGMTRLKPTTEVAHGAAVTCRVTFNEGVTGVDPTDFTIVLISGEPTGLLAANAVAPVGTTGTTFDVTISSITKYVTLRLDLKENGTGITDIAGNALTGGLAGPNYTIDPAPIVETITRQSPLADTTGLSDVTFRVTFSEKVTGVDPSDFYPTTVSGDARGTLAVLGNEVLASKALPLLTAVGTTGMVYDVTVHAVAGTGAMRLDVKESGTGIKDTDGQPLYGGFTGGEPYYFQQSTAQRFASVTDLSPVPIAKNTADKPQGKVWYYASKWWSVLSTPSGTRLFRLDGTSWTDVLTLSSSQTVHADCRVVGSVVHILMFEPEDDSQLVSVEYDAGTGKYKLWSQRTSKVDLDFGSGSESATLAIDGRGRMWIASCAKTDVNVRWSDAPYSNWSDTFRIAEGILDDDICAITTLPGKIGVLWSNQNTQRFGFKTHTDGGDPRNWSADEEPASSSAQSKGNGFGDDHMNVICASDGTLYCAVKTSYDTPGYTKIGLLKRTTSGNWSFYPACSIEGTRGIAVLNEGAGTLKIVYCSKEEGGDIVYRETALSNISFGPPKTLISGKYLFNEATSTHQPMGGEVVILATNQDTEPKLAVGVLARDAGAASAPAITEANGEQEALTINREASRDNWLASLAAFPNPVSGRATVTFTLPQSEKYRLVLYDSKGAKLSVLEKGRVEGGRVQTLSIDAGRLPGGLYLLRLQTATGSKTMQLVVEK
ncbi:Ig-like domain-containing protein [Paraflavisolibacter sp. H34]|uniref:Ig-like domain-containing protein n=1 Tax=Huijunlia imazamoxiresistens TaxID=3127457 RepID=UPI003018739B